MRCRGAVVLLLAGGCDVVFQLPEVGAIRCWDPSLKSYDEDRDGQPDGCDLCPDDPEPGQLDEDGDGVGDACDPHPGDPSDRLVFFDGFNTTPADPRWTMIGGTGQWTFGGGVAQQTDPTATSAGLALAMQLTNATIGITVELDDAATASHRIGASADFYEFQGELRGVQCATERANGSSQLRILELPNTANAGEAPFAPGALTRIRVGATGECVGRSDTAANVRVALSNAPIAVDGGQVGIFAIGAAATFHAVTVIVTDP